MTWPTFQQIFVFCQPITKGGRYHNFCCQKQEKESNDMQNKLNEISGSEGDVVNQNFRSSFSENKGFKVM
jgi:hypothetical protein